MEIDEFIEKLSEYKSSDTVYNMYYGNSDTAKKCRENLKQYLERHKNSQILLVGEAPGYKGCARTGVPFTSDDNEVSAGVIQKAIEDKDVLTWNAFPFHPHKKDDRNSNRTPNAKQLLQGEEIFKCFLQTFPNAKCFGAVGKVAEKALRKGNFGCSYIRHPAYGGKNGCENGLKELFKRYEKMKRAGFLDWPSYISNDDCAKYTNKIKLEYITKAVCEGNDLYYEHATSKWSMTLDLNINDRSPRVFICGKENYKEIEDMIVKSGKFSVKAEEPNTLRKYTYIRKA